MMILNVITKQNRAINLHESVPADSDILVFNSAAEGSTSLESDIDWVVSLY